MKILLLFLLLTVSTLADIPTYTHIIANKQVGPVTSTSTWKDVAAIVGTAYVEEGKVYVGEGNYLPATIVYPGHPNRTLKIVWKDGPKATATPDSVWLMGKETEWRTPNGITLGTGLSRLEKLNGKPFNLLGFAWDFGGMITNWNNGNLESQLQNVSVRLMIPEVDEKNVGFDATTQIMGDVQLSSGHPLFMQQEPVIDRIVVTFP